MTERFTKFVNGFVFPHECHFKKGHWGDMNFVTWENVSGDAGGVTKYGIDQRSHPNTDIKNLTEEQAKQIYWREYWLPVGADHLPKGWGEFLVDVKINGGDGPRMAQRAINILGHVPQLALDGKIGPITVQGMVATGDKGLIRSIQYRDSRYRTLAAKPHLAKFLKGWLKRNEDLREFLELK